MNEFLQRLKQRKLVQWTVAYVAAAFALLQGLDIVANRFDLPSQTIRLVIVAMIAGFFVVLVLAWYHGERGAQKISGIELLIIWSGPGRRRRASLAGSRTFREAGDEDAPDCARRCSSGIGGANP